MIYGFDTEDGSMATAALLVYATWRSRDTARFRVTPDVWSQIERFVKAAAKRSGDLAEFIEALMPGARTLAPCPDYVRIACQVAPGRPTKEGNE